MPDGENLSARQKPSQAVDPGRKTASFIMRGATVLRVKDFLKKNYHSKGAWGVMTTSAPNKQEDNNLGEGSTVDDNTEPIVAFSKPPLPPILGPLVAVSLLELGSSDSDKDS